MVAEDDEELTRIARELYQEPPASFTAARNERAKAMASDQSRALAAGIRRLPKPSAAVWALNYLAIHEAQTVSEFTTLGAKLRTAQQHADRHQLDALVAQRKSLLMGTMKLVKKFSSSAGVQLSVSAFDQIEQSLHAALADEDGANAVFSGRLIEPIHSDGLDPVDLSSALAGPAPAASASRRVTSRSATTPTKRVTKPDRARIQQTRSAAARADAAVEELRRLKSELDNDHAQLERDIETLQNQFDALEKRREELDARSAKLDANIRDALSASGKAHNAADEAETPR